MVGRFSNSAPVRRKRLRGSERWVIYVLPARVATSRDANGALRFVKQNRAKTAVNSQKNRLASAAIPSRVTSPKAKELRAPRRRRINRPLFDEPPATAPCVIGSYRFECGGEAEKARLKLLSMTSTSRDS